MTRRRKARSGPIRDQANSEAIDHGRLVILVAVGIATAAVLASIVVGLAIWPRHSTPSQPTAVIIDQLAATDPDPQFVVDAAHELQSAGFRVDYYKPNEVTVDFYRSLPELGYKFIVLRSHSSDQTYPLDETPNDSQLSVGLFTNEPYRRDTHLDDQRAMRLTVDSYTDRNIEQQFFGITPAFMAYSAHGRFSGTTVLLMGCAGLKATDLAQAFVSRGAVNFIGWDGAVTAAHTDAGAKKLIENLFGLHMDVRGAVATTSEEIGPDPSYGGRLRSYP